MRASSNADIVRKHIRAKQKAVHAECEKSVAKTAKDIRNTLYAKTPISHYPYTAVRTTKGKPTWPVQHGGEGHVRQNAFTVKGRDAIFLVLKTQGRVGALGKSAEILGYLEEGTRAHGPVNKKFLRFATPGGVVFTKKVKGVKPHRIFSSTRLMYSRIWPKRIKFAVGEGLKVK